VGKRARSFAERYGHAPVATLPLGTKRTLAYLAAVGHTPKLLVLDEPTSGMDALTRARLWENLRALADNGTGILVTTHYMQEAAQCDRLVMLAAGKVTGTGTVDEITAGHSSLVVTAKRWEEAFKLLQDAGIPALGLIMRLLDEVEELRKAQQPGRQLAYELAEVCRLVRAGARESDLHPLSSSVAAIAALEEARRQVGVRFPADEQG